MDKIVSHMDTISLTVSISYIKVYLRTDKEISPLCPL